MRLIDADKLREGWVNHLHIPNPDSYFAVQQEISSECVADFIQSIDTQPTVEPVKHAPWIESKEGYFSCSNCHKDAMVDLYEIRYSQKLTLFCPNCGAIMDEEVNNDA